LIKPDLMAPHGWSVPKIMWDKGGMEPIIPFLTDAVRQAPGIYIGPTCMTPHSISLATTQRLPYILTMRTRTGRNHGLPLTRDWVFSALDHLLHSATSTVFKSLPSSWDASETEIVRASLLLAIVVRQLLNRYSLNGFLMSREEAVFGCMKIFMLEHEQPNGESVQEVFRDVVVEKFMDDLLTPFQFSTISDTDKSIEENLEKVAVRFLGPSIPFYQYYTDFVALYDSISFSDPQFARLLLPPTSMRYPPDYRKHLWGDFGHILRTIQTPFDRVISGDIREYLWPLETDGFMLRSYLQALVKGTLASFVRLIAVHHIACNIWPDLARDSHETDKSVKLLRAIVEQGNGSLVKEIVQYQQDECGALLPPACFEQNGEWKQARIEWVGRLFGVAMQTRLSPLL